MMRRLHVHACSSRCSSSSSGNSSSKGSNIVAVQAAIRAASLPGPCSSLLPLHHCPQSLALVQQSRPGLCAAGHHTSPTARQHHQRCQKLPAIKKSVCFMADSPGSSLMLYFSLTILQEEKVVSHGYSCKCKLNMC